MNSFARVRPGVRCGNNAVADIVNNTVVLPGTVGGMRDFFKAQRAVRLSIAQCGNTRETVCAKCQAKNKADNCIKKPLFQFCTSRPLFCGLLEI